MTATVLALLALSVFPASAQSQNFEIHNPANFRCLSVREDSLVVSPCFPNGEATFRWYWQAHRGNQYLVNLKHSAYCVNLVRIRPGHRFLQLRICDYSENAPGIGDQWEQAGNRIKFRHPTQPTDLCFTRYPGDGVSAVVNVDTCSAGNVDQEWQFVPR
ncbi:hypothetical protein [Nocardia sp. NPDC051832]|uniref:hypothetical protein n=1 Tax=Nocardia sp. NPDC051832 TaxID=3155673 RepID=UPI003435E9A2